MLKSDQNNTAFKCIEISPLSTAIGLYDASMCAVDDKFIYVTGGLSDGRIVSKCHRYDIDRNQWEEMQ